MTYRNHTFNLHVNPRYISSEALMEVSCITFNTQGSEKSEPPTKYTCTFPQLAEYTSYFTEQSITHTSWECHKSVQASFTSYTHHQLHEKGHRCHQTSTFHHPPTQCVCTQGFVATASRTPSYTPHTNKNPLAQLHSNQLLRSDWHHHIHTTCNNLHDNKSRHK